MELEERIKKVIIERLNLDIDPGEIANDAPIFSGGLEEGDNPEQSLGLDSIDALEMVIALNKEFNVTITDENMDIFRSVNTIAEYIRQNSSG